MKTKLPFFKKISAVAMIAGSLFVTAGCSNGEEAPVETVTENTPAPVLSENPRIKQISLGESFTCALTVEGGVKCWGANDRGQLGRGTTTPVMSDPKAAIFHKDSANPVPELVKGLESGVKFIASGWAHSCALLRDDTVKCWGDNAWGQLGNGVKADGVPKISNVPVPVTGITDVKELSVGQGFSCALTNKGAVKCWGENSAGSLGNGSFDSSGVPVTTATLQTDVREVATASGFACAILDGAVRCWGLNTNGELGNSTKELSSNIPLVVPALREGVKKIVAGSGHACALLDDNTVKCWGRNNESQLATGSAKTVRTPTVARGLDEDIKDLSVRGGNTCSVNIKGEVKCWGDNTFASAGVSIPAPGQGDLIVAKPNKINGVERAWEVVSGPMHGCAITETDVKCWGSNTFGQLSKTDEAISSDSVRIEGL